MVCYGFHFKILHKTFSPPFQGIVLGAFFWGYPFFQIIGGIVSDRIGGDYVLYRATLIWSVIAIITPQVPYYYHTKRGTISAMAFMRFLMGLTQGMIFLFFLCLIFSSFV